MFFTVRDITAGADRFSISNLGNATFAGNVLLNGYLSVEGTTGNTGGATDRWIGGDGTAGTWFYNVPTGSSHLFGINNSNVLTLNGTGATFSGIITANSSSSGDYVRLYGSSGTGKWDIYGNGANLRISDNESAGILAVDTGATFGGTVTAAGGTMTADTTFNSNIILEGNIFHKDDTNTYFGFNTGSSTDDVITFATNNVQRLTIDSSGRVGIGIDPFAWDSSFNNIQIGNKISLFNASTNGGLSFNQYYNGTNNIYQTNGTANRVQMDADGFHFYQAASGTAGNTATFTESMRIDSSGKVSVGICTGNLKEFNVKNQGSNGGLRIEHSGSVNTVAFLGQGGSGDEGVLFLQDSGVDTVKIAGENGLDSFINSGNVGIGVTDPVTKLDVRGGTGGGSFDHATFTSVTSRGLKISTANSSEGQNGAAVIYNAQDGENYGSHAFQIGGSTKMFIKGNNVGIGTTSPNNKLEISDTGVGTGSTHLKISRGANATAVQRIAGIKMGNTASNDGSNWIIQADSSLGYFDSANLDFIHNAAGTANTKMRITSGGNVAIGGTLGADSQFRVEFKPAGTILAGLRIGYNSTSNNYFDGDNQYFRDGAGTTNRMTITSGGNVLIGKTSTDIDSDNGFRFDSNGEGFASISTPDTGIGCWFVRAISTSAYKFYVRGDGQIFATSTSISAISDITLKENIKPLETGLNEVMKLQPRRFDWKNGEGQNIAGFIAQEVEEILPDLIDEFKYDDDIKKKSLKMGDMIPTLVKAIQELKAEIEILKNK